MLFTQIEFYLFFAAIVSAMLAFRSFSLRKWVLLVASYYFYAYWDWRFAGLLLSCTAVNFWLAAAMVGASRRPRKWLLAAALVYSLGVLGFFKYFGFFLETFKSVVGVSSGSFSGLDIILPVGISFYTFQTLSYSIDVYRGHLTPCRHFRDFALYVSFFPQLVAGPIVRASEFLPQLEVPNRLSWERTFDGFRQFVIGLFKKVFIADRLALFIDPGFENASALSGASLWILALAYAVQIYCDFSGYSDMAIGAARILGFDFSRNFDHPYLATSIQDFWRRWHISLSSWLRDYLYIPLGGNRRGSARTYINLMITMVLGGLWHGASWNFVIWGAIHGIALCLDRIVTRRSPGEKLGISPLFRKSLGWATTMFVVTGAWVFFRSPDFDTALEVLGKMIAFENGIGWYPPFALAVLSVFAGYHILFAWMGWRTLPLPATAPITPLVLFLMIWLVIAFFPQGFQPFIYFQF